MKKNRYKIKRFWDKLSKGEKVDLSHSFIKMTHAADIAEIIANLTNEETQIDTFLEFLSDEQKGKVFSELPEDVQQEVLEKINLKPLLELFKKLPPDEAVDLLSMVGEEKQDFLIRSLSEQQQGKFRRLLLYGKDSAGGIMTPLLISVRKDQTAANVIELLKKNREHQEVFFNIFVVDDQEKLIGSVSLQSLLISDPQILVSEIMQVDLIALSVHDDQEVVAQTVSKYNLLTVPVVDDAGRLLGRITLDDVMEVFQEEADEDLYLMAGLGIEDARGGSALVVARSRLPWLLTCLCGSFFSGVVIRFYQAPLAQVILILLVFLPAICAMGGNSGLQASTVTIRNLCYEGVFYKNIRRLVKREVLAGVSIGLVAGTVVGCVACFWLKNFFLGLIIAVSMMLTIFISTCTGFFIPIFFNKIGIDPAIASGPLITTLNDATSTFLYLSIATILLYWFHF